MKTGRTVFLALLVAIVLWLADVAFAVADPTFSFNLIGPSTTKAPTGEIIEMTGSGNFNSSTGQIVASGSFIISSANGDVVARGTWSATTFIGFTSFGGPRPGTQGGHLSMTATLSSGGAPLLMTVTCRVFAPPGAGPEGVTIGNFTTIVHGLTVFHLD